LSRSGDIRDQTLKWSKIDRNFACFWPQIFLGESPPNFWSGVIKLHQIPTMWQSFRAIGRGTSENEWRNKKRLDGQGRARREAARRCKSECKVNLDIPNSCRSSASKRLQNCILEPRGVWTASTYSVQALRLNCKANFKFSRFFFGGGDPAPLRVCASKPWPISSVCKNFRAQHSLRAEI